MIKKILVRPKLFTQLSILEMETKTLYHKALHRFMNESSHGLNLEKLHGGQLYSIRVNQQIRLILTPRKHQGQQVWLLVEILDDHDYNKLLKKPNSWLHQQIITTLDVGVKLEAHLETNSIIDEPFALEQEQGITYHNRQFIILDSQQQQIQKHPLPLIISGAPGSGKTSIAQFLLSQFIHALKSGSKLQHLCYLAQSETLVQAMRDGWQTLCELEFPELVDVDVEFKTPLALYNDWLSTQPSSSAQPHPALVNDRHFTTWLTAYIKKYNRSRKVNHQLSVEELLGDYSQNHELIYQECRNISGYHSFNEYDELVGARFSLFIDPKARQWLWVTYHQYIQHLEDSHLVDLSFLPIRLPQTVDFLIVDEAADLSGLQLRSLPTQVTHHQLALCIGDHQRLHGSESIVPFIKYVFWQRHIAIHHEALRSSYRNPPQVTLLANAALQLKFKANKSALIRDHGELFYVKSLVAHKGDIHWLANEQELKPLIADHNNADFAVITCAAFLDEARSKFGKERVFTSEGIKGLEYKHILIYRLLEQPGFKAANQIIGDHCELQVNPDDFILAKNDEGTIVHNQIFNELFVAITRAQHSVSMYQPESSSIRYIRDALMRFIRANTLSATHTQAIPTHSSSEDWQQRERQLAAHQQNEQAQAINERLNKNSNKVPSPPTPRASSNSVAHSPTKSKKAASNKIVPQPNEHSTLIKRIIGGDYSAIKPLLKQHNALVLLFNTSLKSLNLNSDDLSLFSWFIKKEQLTELVKAVHSILKEYVAIAKPTAEQKDAIDKFMQLIHFIPLSLNKATEQRSLISYVTATTSLHKKIIRFIAPYTPQEQPKQKSIQPLINELYPDLDEKFSIPDIPAPPLVRYSLNCAALPQIGAPTDLYLHTIIDKPCLSSLPDIFFRVFMQERQPDQSYKAYIKLDSVIPAANSRVPIRLADLLHNHNAPRPTYKQLIHLFVAISQKIDELDASLTFWPNMHSIFITHLNDIGSNKPLTFKFCPISVMLTRELPAGIQRTTIIHRQMASIFLLLAAHTNSIDDPALAFKAAFSLMHAPALATVFFELWEQTLSGFKLPSNQLLTMSSPTLSYLTAITKHQLKKAKIKHVTAIMSSLSIVTSFSMVSHLVNSLYRLATTGTTHERARALGLVAHSVENLIDLLERKLLPQQTQETILKLIVLIFEQLEQCGDYSALHQLQQRLMAKSIIKRLDLFKQSCYSDDLHIFAIQILIWLAFQFEAMSIELFMPERVCAMISSLLFASSTGLIEQKTAHKYIIMLLILSDFDVWMEPLNHNNDGIEELWHNIKAEVFIKYGLPCYSHTLSVGTTAAIIKKLELIIIELISTRDKKDAIKEQQIEHCLNYLLFLQWNGVEQVNSMSHYSQQEANKAAFLFKKPAHSLLVKVPTFSHHLARSNPLQNMFNYLTHLTPKNGGNHPQIWHTFKEPINAHYIAQVAPTHVQAMNAHYLPNPDPLCTYSSSNGLALNIPDNGMINHSKDKIANSARIYGLSAKQLAEQKNAFISTTLSTKKPMFTIKNTKERTGTQAMLELHMDTASTINLVVGITWNRTKDQNHITPGSSPTSLGFVLNTGHIRYLSAKGLQIERPYSPPCKPGDKIALGISNRKVYLIINGLFYPLIEEFTLACGDIYPLIEVNSPGCHFIMDIMNSQWSNELNDEGDPIYSAANMVANSLYEAYQDYCACPHYHTLFDSDETSHHVRFNALVKSPHLIAELPQSWQRMLLLILLAQHPCKEQCEALAIFNTLRDIPESEYHTTASLAPLHLARLMGLNEWVDAINVREQAPASGYKGAFFKSMPLSAAKEQEAFKASPLMQFNHSAHN